MGQTMPFSLYVVKAVDIMLSSFCYAVSVYVILVLLVRRRRNFLSASVHFFPKFHCP